jgi:outer membrane protein assembly factor BamD (BamD/ComL family)
VAGDNEKISRYLSLFGLSSSFTKEELTRSYRTLAKLNHPDLNQDAAAQMRMVIINAGYEYLAGTAGTAETGEAAVAGSAKKEDPAYVVYREGFESLTRAFELYYAEGAQARADRMELFLSGLRAAKELLARVIREYPQSQWTGDAIDKVMSINLWLRD